MKEIRYKKRLRHICAGGFIETHHKKPMLRMADTVELVWHFGDRRYKTTKQWLDIGDVDNDLYPPKRLTNENK